MTDFSIVLFEGFEPLDAFGPAEIAGMLPEQYRIEYFSVGGDVVTGNGNVRVETLPFSWLGPDGVLLIPGGPGTRALVNDEAFLGALREVAERSAYVLSVCTGAALLAKTGLLEGLRATTNKRAFDWVRKVGLGVVWLRSARWVVDERFYTSSGISAGMDMTLGFLRDRHGVEIAREAASHIEYVWNEDREQDPFAR